MPEGWDGITKDLDEVHYEISQKEDEMLYQEFVQKMNFNKKKVSSFDHYLMFSNRVNADVKTYSYADTLLFVFLLVLYFRGIEKPNFVKVILWFE